VTRREFLSKEIRTVSDRNLLHQEGNSSQEILTISAAPTGSQEENTTLVDPIKRLQVRIHAEHFDIKAHALLLNK
jgi:hypothetical protein